MVLKQDLFFPPMHTLPIYNRKKEYPVAEYLANTGINIPCWPGMNKIQVEYVINQIYEHLK